jgi:RNA polymerase sigma-70 factor (ECF subfamily)
VERVQTGDEAAVRELIENYGPHIIRVVRRRLNKRLRSKFDSDDFVQAVWASFLVHLRDLSRFDGPEALAAFLADLARNKVVDEVRRRLVSEKRNVGREQSLDDSVFEQHGELQSPLPTASQVAIAQETWDRLVQGQPSHYGKMVDLRRAGDKHKEIAAKLGFNEKTIRRVIARLTPEHLP